MADFYDRVIRFEKMRDRGYGFEAAGTLGRTQHRAKPSSGRNWLGTAVLVAFSVFAFKAAIFYGVGAESYQIRVDRLLAAEGIDRVGGYLMQADPVTLWMAERIEMAALQIK